MTDDICEYEMGCHMCGSHYTTEAIDEMIEQLEQHKLMVKSTNYYEVIEATISMDIFFTGVIQGLQLIKGEQSWDSFKALYSINSE